MLNSTSIKVAKKYEGMIEEIYQDSDGYWAHSAKGFEFEGMGCHTAHEYTQKDLLDMIRTLKPCECSECKAVEVAPVAEPIKEVKPAEKTKISITELKLKGFNEEDLKDLVGILNLIPVGGLQTVFVGVKRDGSQVAKEYRKVSKTHVELVRNYEYS